MLFLTKNDLTPYFFTKHLFSPVDFRENRHYISKI